VAQGNGIRDESDMVANTPFGHPGRVIKNESHSNGVNGLMAITHVSYL
jgi:hypothetical protein